MNAFKFIKLLYFRLLTSVYLCLFCSCALITVSISLSNSVCRIYLQYVMHDKVVFCVRTSLTCRLHHVGVISNYATRTRGRKRPEGSCLLAGNDSFEAVTVTRFARQLSSLSLQNILPSRLFRLLLPRRLRLHRCPFRLIRNTLRSATMPLIIRMMRPLTRFEQGKQT